MNPASCFYRCVLTLVLTGAVCVMAQQPNTRPRVMVPGGPPMAVESKALKSNYRITYSAKLGEKSLGELSTLTCSSIIRIEGPLDAEDSTSVSATGSLEEREGGGIMFDYQLGFLVPFAKSVPAQPNGSNVMPGQSQHRNHTVSGSLMMKPGKAYEVLRAGSIVYTVTITAEPD